MYYFKPPRIYILTKRESETQKIRCPKCGKVLRTVPFTKKDKLYRCLCGFYIPKSCVLNEVPKEGKGILEEIAESENMEIGDQLTRIADDLRSFDNIP